MNRDDAREYSALCMSLASRFSWSVYVDEDRHSALFWRTDRVARRRYEFRILFGDWCDRCAFEVALRRRLEVPL